MYKVFFKDSVFFLTDNTSPLKNNVPVYAYQDREGLQLLVGRFLATEKPFSIAIQDPDIDLLFSVFRKGFHYVEAAGGVVMEGENILVIKRAGVYDLPKGVVERGELPERAAIREVEEECGITGLSIIRTLFPTFHIYYRDEKAFLKKVYWYFMACPSGQTPVPQAEEDIESAFWMNKRELPRMLSNTFASIREVLGGEAGVFS